MFRQISTGNIYNLEQLRALFPNTAIPSDIPEHSLNEMGFERYIYPTPPPTPLTLEQVQSNKEQDIRNYYAQQIENIIKPYSLQERETWFQQVNEADAWYANNNSPTPLIDGIIAVTAETKINKVNTIRAKRDAYIVSVGQILGIQQAKIAQVYAATTIAEVDAITIP